MAVAPPECRLNVWRLGSSHLGYRAPRLKASINGVSRGVRIEGLTVREYQGGTANQATMRVSGVAPTKGHVVVLGLGTLEAKKALFKGRIRQVTQVFESEIVALAYDLDVIGNEWRLNGRKVTGKFTATSATDVVLWIMSHAPPGFSVAGVEAGLPSLDEIQFTDVNVTDALDRVQHRIGAAWVLDDADVLHYGFDILADATGVHPITDANAHGARILSIADDLATVRTRIYTIGGGGSAMTLVSAGETLLPVDDVSRYDPAGGSVMAGPQIIAYEDVDAGGSGALVGPGAAPSTAPVLALAAGSGMESGFHDYAISYETAAGESLPGPLGTIEVGTVTPARDAPSIAGLSSGGSVNSGDHDYVCTLVTASGETTPTAISASATTGGASASPPASAPTVNGPTAAGSVTPGVHKYAVTFVGASGETAAGPDSSNITAIAPYDPPTAPSAAHSSAGQEVGPGTYTYRATFVNAGGETTQGSDQSVAIEAVNPPTSANPTLTPTTGGSMADGSYAYKISNVTANGETMAWPANGVAISGGNNAVQLTNLPISSDPRVSARRIYRELGAGGSVLLTTINDNTTTSFLDTVSQASIAGGPSAPGADTGTNYGRVSLTNIQIGPSGTTARRIYRTQPGSGSSLFLLTTINNNTATTHTDTTANVSANPAPPSVNTTGLQTIGLTSIPVGPSGTTARRIYRTAAAGSQLKFLAEVPNNSATTYSDTIADGSLGADAPTGSTLNTINLSGIPIGGSIVTGRKVYRRFNGSGTFKLAATISDNTTTTHADTASNASLGADAPSTNTAAANRVSLTAIPTGVSDVTARHIYRTTAGGSQLKLVDTIGDNTTTTYEDGTADGSLGANAPTEDTSDLVQPQGQLNQGSTSLLVASSGPFRAAGGWVVIGNGQQVIRYTGVDDGELTGIPSSGPGAITASISYGSTVTACPMLTGVPSAGNTGAILYDIPTGEPVNLRMMAEDLDAQEALRVAVESSDALGFDGVVEDVVRDERWSYVEAGNQAAARLAEAKDSLQAIAYTTRDYTTRAGREVTFNLTEPSLSGTVRIQSVTLSEFDNTGTIRPLRTVVASSRLETLEQLLRQRRGA